MRSNGRPSLMSGWAGSRRRSSEKTSSLCSNRALLGPDLRTLSAHAGQKTPRKKTGLARMRNARFCLILTQMDVENWKNDEQDAKMLPGMLFCKSKIQPFDPLRN